MLFATDLDRTIIYSNKFVENYQTVSCVEHLDGREISYMSHRALELLAQVKTRYDIHLVPITTRSLAQFSRIIPLQDCPYAVVANGGIILHKGQPLKVWQEHIERTRQIQALDYPKILDILTKYQKYLTRTPSLVDNLFFFTKVTESQDIVQEFILPSLEKDLKNLEWTFTLQGLKLYIIPKEISKENALSFLK
uniref:HAD family hydrolase n=1 Tax=Streptococcus sanguinis TaxID=1305 RepID=UPI00066A2A0F